MDLTDAAARPPGALREFGAGAGTLLRGFRAWGRSPRLMLLGALPAVIVGAVVLAAFVLLLTRMDDLARVLTPFAEGWADSTRTLVHLAAGAAVLIAAVLLAVATFTALTLAVGDPFYERIWRSVESDLGDFRPADEPGFWRALGRAAATGIRLLLPSLALGVLLFAVGLVPVVGGVLGVLLGAVLGGRLLAAELLDRPLGARGLDGAAQASLRRGHRARVTGFGACAYLLFLLPLGAVVAMPAAVAGSALLARDLLPPAPPAESTD